ncbi:MAG TPA: phospholipid carrier-dependent glycosyltransferase [Anaerolineales bacterium]|nr:phospholipid carrier-dependent glycosyltransferase [Anaerolineales bacterium]
MMILRVTPPRQALIKHKPTFITSRAATKQSSAAGAEFWRRALPILIIGLVGVWFVATGLQGIDFGYHWDEEKQFANLAVSLEEELLLPRWYKYPSISYWLTLGASLPHLLAALPNSDGDWHVLQAHLLLVAQTPAFHLQTRALFLLVSALAIFWTGVQPMLAGRSAWEGALAAAFLGLSWEFAYHARWVAPDTILLQFGALFLLPATFAARRPAQIGWGIAAAAAAGLATGAKYPGGLLLIPAWLITVLVLLQQPNFSGADNTRPVRFWLAAAFQATMLTVPAFLFAFLVTTPGAALDPVNFIKDIRYEIGHYSTGRFDQTVTPGLPHLLLIWRYFMQVFFSFSTLVALFFSLLSLFGAVITLRALERRNALALAENILLILFPALYLLYFSTQRVMAARNLLLAAPFFALLAARGAYWIYQRLDAKPLQIGWIVLLLGAFAYNTVWLGYAARSIQARGTGAELGQLIDYAQATSRSTIETSPGLWAALQNNSLELPPNLLPPQYGATDLVAFFASEAFQDPTRWPANQPGLALAYFGPWEVNFDYYPLWAGDDRILLMTRAQAVQREIEPFIGP